MREQQVNKVIAEVAAKRECDTSTINDRYFRGGVLQ